MNTSRIGENLLNTTATSSSSDPLSSLINNITNTIAGDLNNIILNPLAESLASQLGLQDFYSAHLLDYCSGYFTPAPIPNATLSASDIHRNVTMCGNHTSMFTFDPRAALTESINNSGLGLDPNQTLAKLAFPDDIETQVQQLHAGWKVMFVLYCVGIALSFICFFLSAAALFMSEGRRLPAVNVLLFIVDTVVLGIASALATALAYAGRDRINQAGKPIGVTATAGTKFVGLTWGLTTVLLVGTLVWCGGCIVPMTRNRKRGVHKIG